MTFYNIMRTVSQFEWCLFVFICLNLTSQVCCEFRGSERIILAQTNFSNVRNKIQDQLSSSNKQSNFLAKADQNSIKEQTQVKAVNQNQAFKLRKEALQGMLFGQSNQQQAQVLTPLKHQQNEEQNFTNLKKNQLTEMKEVVPIKEKNTFDKTIKRSRINRQKFQRKSTLKEDYLKKLKREATVYRNQQIYLGGKELEDERYVIGSQDLFQQKQKYDPFGLQKTRIANKMKKLNKAVSKEDVLQEQKPQLKQQKKHKIKIITKQKLRQVLKSKFGRKQMYKLQRQDRAQSLPNLFEGNLEQNSVNQFTRMVVRQSKRFRLHNKYNNTNVCNSNYTLSSFQQTAQRLGISNWKVNSQSCVRFQSEDISMKVSTIGQKNRIFLIQNAQPKQQNLREIRCNSIEEKIFNTLATCFPIIVKLTKIMKNDFRDKNTVKFIQTSEKMLINLMPLAQNVQGCSLIIQSAGLLSSKMNHFMTIGLQAVPAAIHQLGDLIPKFMASQDHQKNKYQYVTQTRFSVLRELSIEILEIIDKLYTFFPWIKQQQKIRKFQIIN